MKKIGTGKYSLIKDDINDNFEEMCNYSHLNNMYNALHRIPAFFKRINPESTASPYYMLKRFVINSSPDSHGYFEGLSRLLSFTNLIKDDSITGNIVKAIVMQGDLVREQNTKADDILLCDNLEAVSKECEIDFLTGLGNHDMNNLHGNTTDLVFSKAEQKEYMLTKPMANVSNLVFDSNNNDACYWYKDYDEGDSYKVRIIMLDQYDMPQNIIGDSYKYTMKSALNFSNKQLNWFANVALNLPSEDWHVIVFGHESPTAATTYNNSNVAMYSIIDAFATQGIVNLSSIVEDFEYSIDIDFSAINGFNGNFISYFYGHGHIPLVSKITIHGHEYNNIELPSIDASSIGYSRIKDTGTYDMSTFIVVDTEDRKIFLLRYGCPCDVNGNGLPNGDYGIETEITY